MIEILQNKCTFCNTGNVVVSTSARTIPYIFDNVTEDVSYNLPVYSCDNFQCSSSWFEEEEKEHAQKKAVLLKKQEIDSNRLFASVDIIVEANEWEQTELINNYLDQRSLLKKEEIFDVPIESKYIALGLVGNKEFGIEMRFVKILTRTLMFWCSITDVLDRSLAHNFFLKKCTNLLTESYVADYRVFGNSKTFNYSMLALIKILKSDNPDNIFEQALAKLKMSSDIRKNYPESEDGKKLKEFNLNRMILEDKMTKLGEERKLFLDTLYLNSQKITKEKL